jgi:hypothetical protein
MASITAQFSNHFDLYKGRKAETQIEQIATITDIEIAWQLVGTVHEYLIKTTDIFDYVEVTLELNGAEEYRSRKVATMGYEIALREHNAATAN